MKSLERILLKLIVIQCICLVFSQMIFHREDSFLELKKLARYEGVNSGNHTKIIETFNGYED